MHSWNLAAAAIGLLSTSTLAQQSAWGQCGGSGFSGSSTCVSGYTCIELSDAYSQCQPGTASPSSTASPTTNTTTTTTTSGPGPTLLSPYLWIRAVAAPNYHKYLQSAPLLAAGPATLSNSTTAGQFSITAAGQLVQLISAPDASEEQLLYAHVAGATTHGGQSLAVSFAAEEGTYGTWAFSGDALTWTAANVSRPNLSAWYVCEGQAVYVNLGAYLYNTPDGCADQTIHYYNDATAND